MARLEGMKIALVMVAELMLRLLLFIVEVVNWMGSWISKIGLGILWDDMIGCFLDVDLGQRRTSRK